MNNIHSNCSIKEIKKSIINFEALKVVEQNAIHINLSINEKHPIISKGGKVKKIISLISR